MSISSDVVSKQYCGHSKQYVFDKLGTFATQSTDVLVPHKDILFIFCSFVARCCLPIVM